MAISGQTLRDAALLSGAVYDNSPQDLDLGDWRILSYLEIGHGLTDSDFGEVLTGDSDYFYDHFNSEAFIAVNGNKLALVFRGSEGLSQLQDYTDAAFNQAEHYADFSDLISAFNGFVNDAFALGTEYEILVTGHSLGGAMAEIYITQDAAALWQPTLITFGSPGVNADARGGLPVDSVAADAIHFAHTGDPITYAQELVGGGGDLHGSIVEIDLPEFTNGPSSSSELLSPLEWMQLGANTEEHLSDVYQASIINLLLSPTLFEIFIANPGGYDVSESEQTALNGSGLLP